MSFPARIAKDRQRGNEFYAPIANEAQTRYEQMMDATHAIRKSTTVTI